MMASNASRLRKGLAYAALCCAIAPALAHAEGTGMFSPAKLMTTDGGEIYRSICQGCHMPDGRGATGAGKYPALAKDPALLSTQFMAVTLLQGRRNMPSFAGDGHRGFFFVLPVLNDEQIASVINYVRSNFGNHYKGSISAEQVKALRGPA